MSSLKKAVNDGYFAFYRGNLNNPYKTGSMQHKEFERGFNYAYFENLEAVKQAEEKRTAASR